MHCGSGGILTSTRLVCDRGPQVSPGEAPAEAHGGTDSQPATAGGGRRRATGAGSAPLLRGVDSEYSDPALRGAQPVAPCLPTAPCLGGGHVRTWPKP